MKKLLLTLPLLLLGTQCPPFNPVRTIFVGDSITFGAGSGTGFDPATHSFFALLDNDTAFDNYELINAGCGGASTYDWVDIATLTACGSYMEYDLYDAEITEHFPLYNTYIMLGTNDSVGFFNPSGVVTKAQYKANLKDLVERLLAHSIRIVIMTPPPNVGNPTANALLAEYVDAIHEICEEVTPIYTLECGTVDVYNTLTTSDFAGTDIHPNMVGHWKISNLIKENLNIE